MAPELSKTRHISGLWESAIKATKYHLWRVIREQKLTFEELYNPLAQIESCLNSPHHFYVIQSRRLESINLFSK